MAAYTSILDRVRAKLKTKPVAIAQAEAVKWFQNEIRKLGGTDRAHLLADAKRSKEWFYPGFMYLFVYDPKLKKTLPYYDKFPLVFPVEFYDDGFLGINLHYLDYKMRLTLFHALLSQVDLNVTNKKARMILSYQTLKAFSRFKLVKPCLKRYLTSHVQSQAIRIEGPDWETALFLRVENFAKKSKTFVWQESAAIASGLQNGPNTSGLPKDTKTTHTTTKPTSTTGLPKKGK